MLYILDNIDNLTFVGVLVILVFAQFGIIYLLEKLADYIRSKIR
jgi:hypothetical protein